ncbi:MAG: cell division protein FtsH, partial [Nannocystaceae bacterium]
TTAWHEAGHTLVAKMLPEGTIDDIHKVTIIPRGQALGVTHLLPDQDRLSVDLVHAQGNIAMLMGGRLAEELRFDGRVTTGAGNDIAKASSLARKMVCEWGMSERLGPIAFGQARSEPFLGRDIQRKQNYSEATAQAIDEEVHRIIDTQYTRAKQLLQNNWAALERIANALVEREVLSADEVQLLVEGKPLPRLTKPEPTPEPPAPASTSEVQESESSSSSGPTGFPIAEPTA